MKYLIFMLLFIKIGFCVPYEQCFDDASKDYGVPKKLLMAIAKVESSFNPYAINVNYKGRSIKEYYPQNKEQAKIVLRYLIKNNFNYDVGIAQINVINIKEYNLDPYGLLDPCINLKTSAMILKRLIDRYGLSWQAVWHYNGRPSYTNLVYKAFIWLDKHSYYSYK